MAKLHQKIQASNKVSKVGLRITPRVCGPDLSFSKRAGHLGHSR